MDVTIALTIEKTERKSNLDIGELEKALYTVPILRIVILELFAISLFMVQFYFLIF